MSKYKIQLKQGKRTLVNYLEAKSVEAVKAFYSTLSTMQVSEILKVEFQDTTTPPIDDFNYQSLFKGFIKNQDSRKVKQIILHNIKVGKNENDIYQACMSHLEIDTLAVDAVSASLFKD